MIEHIRLAELRLEIGTSGQNKPSDRDLNERRTKELSESSNEAAAHLVVLNEHLHSTLGYLSHVVVSLLHPQTSKSKSGLTSSA